jgi:hypothetical protein
LQVLAMVMNQVQERVAYSLNLLVPALASGLASSNATIRALSASATDQLIACCDPSLLIQVRACCLLPT